MTKTLPSLPDLRVIFTFMLIGTALCVSGCADNRSASASYKDGRYAEATKQWQKLAEFGDARAQISLGKAYMDGKGVDADPEKAAYWYGQAAAQDDPRGHFELGRLYEGGVGVEKDPNTALTHYRRSAELDYARGYYYLARLQEHHGLASPDVIRYNYQCALDRGYDRAMDDIERQLRL